MGEVWNEQYDGGLIHDKVVYLSFQKGKVEGIYQEYYRGLVVFARRCLGVVNEFLAEDCVQNAIFEGWKRRASFSNDASLRSFLYVSVRNQSISILRKQNSREKYLSTVEDQTEFLNQMIEEETFTVLFRALETLPDLYRKIFELTYADNLKIKEIAILLGVSEISIKKSKAKALELLRKKLGGSSMSFLLVLYFWKKD